MMYKETAAFANELREAVMNEIKKVDSATSDQLERGYANEARNEFTTILAQIEDAQRDGADMDEFLSINEIFTARQSTLERRLEGHDDIPFNEETGEYIEPTK